jgi:hypothetical protein
MWRVGHAGRGALKRGMNVLVGGLQKDHGIPSSSLYISSYTLHIESHGVQLDNPPVNPSCHT